MIKITENADLQQYNTFNLQAEADCMFEFSEVEELIDYIKARKPFNQTLMLGGGSNMLFINRFNGLIIHPQNRNISTIGEDSEYVYIEADAGVQWDDLVAYSVEQNLSGLENLSLIPGTVGASPVQNIGAYGVEAKDCIFNVKIVMLSSGEKIELTNSQCEFGYRDSIFKNSLKGKCAVTSVVYRFSKKQELKIGYGDVSKEVERLGGASISNVRKAIINIRESKLPDHRKLGNAGSFFKNPIVTNDIATKLKNEYPLMPTYKTDNERYTKLAAGWLIENCGMKGFRQGDAGVHERQALVLVNHGNASGREILALSDKIIASISNKFGIVLDREVNIIR